MLLKSSVQLSGAFEPEYLEYYGILPLELVGGTLRVAAAGAPAREVLEDLERTFQAPLEIIAADSESIVDSVRAHFSAAESTDALARSLHSEDSTSGDVDVLEADARDLANQPPVVRFVNLLIREAFESRASDIHVEATERGPVVRFRIDGVLSPATAPPRSIQAAVISRLKLIANLDIAERRVAQDGRIRIRLEERDLDLRVSTIPTLVGESIVLRILDARGPQELSSLGMPPAIHDAFVQAARRSHGIILSTGPTGSGKTTTLYGALQLRDIAREKIITIEDPVEYRLPGVTQVPVNVKAGMTFAAGLRSVLRQDPDVIMVGEMRDAETAKIAVQAAMTGHIVFSTVHTNNAVSAVTRLADLGVEPYLIAATLGGVLAQRLVRRVCRDCGTWTKAPKSLARLAPHTSYDGELRVGAGCEACRNTGFKGRVGIFEFLRVDDSIRGCIAKSPDATGLAALAAAQGMRGLFDDGLDKVLGGLTTPEEVLRVIEV